MAKTALMEAQARYSDELAAKRFADTMINMLRDFIPENSRRDAWDMLEKAAFEQGFDLTTKQLRKEYEAWKTTQLEGLLNSPPGQG